MSNNDFLIRARIGRTPSDSDGLFNPLRLAVPPIIRIMTEIIGHFMKYRLILGGAACLLIPFIAAHAAGPKHKVLIIAIGDSTTAGTPFFLSPLEAPPDGNGDPEGQYAYWMMRRRPQWNVLNHGIRGETSSQI